MPIDAVDVLFDLSGGLNNLTFSDERDVGEQRDGAGVGDQPRFMGRQSGSAASADDTDSDTSVYNAFDDDFSDGVGGDDNDVDEDDVVRHYITGRQAQTSHGRRLNENDPDEENVGFEEERDSDMDIDDEKDDARKNENLEHHAFGSEEFTQRGRGRGRGQGRGRYRGVWRGDRGKYDASQYPIRKFQDEINPEDAAIRFDEKSADIHRMLERYGRALPPETFCTGIDDIDINITAPIETFIVKHNARNVYQSLRFHGVTREQHTVTALIQDVCPVFYMRPRKSFPRHITARNVLDAIMSNEDVVKAQYKFGLVRKVQLADPKWSSNNGFYESYKPIAELTPLRRLFEVTCATDRLQQIIQRVVENGIIIPGMGGAPVTFDIFNGSIPAAEQFKIHHEMPGAGWLRIPSGSYTVLDSAPSTRSPLDTVTYLCHRAIHVHTPNAITSPPELQQVTPQLRVLSFDIEVAGRKGVFPNPERDPTIQIAAVVGDSTEKLAAHHVLFTWRATRANIVTVRNSTRERGQWFKDTWDLLNKFGLDTAEALAKKTSHISVQHLYTNVVQRILALPPPVPPLNYIYDLGTLRLHEGHTELVQSMLDDIYKQMDEVVTDLITETDELSMLKVFARFIRAADPDVITHYNGNNFDIPYINDRYKTLVREAQEARVAQSLQLSADTMSGTASIADSILGKRTAATAAASGVLDPFSILSPIPPDFAFTSTPTSASSQTSMARVAVKRVKRPITKVKSNDIRDMFRSAAALTPKPVPGNTFEDDTWMDNMQWESTDSSLSALMPPPLAPAATALASALPRVPTLDEFLKMYHSTSTPTQSQSSVSTTASAAPIGSQISPAITPIKRPADEMFGLIWSRRATAQIEIRAMKFESKQAGRTEMKLPSFAGRLCYDMLLVMRKAAKLSSYTLNSVSQYFLYEKKEDVPHYMITPMWNETEDTRHDLGKYCMKDAVLPWLLMTRRNTLLDDMSMCNMTGIPMQFMQERGNSIRTKTVLLRYYRKKNMLMYYKPRSAGKPEKYKGALVVQPKPGYYTVPVATLDFNSLYPTTMISAWLTNEGLVHLSNVCITIADMERCSPIRIPRVIREQWYKQAGAAGSSFILYGPQDGSGCSLEDALRNSTLCPLQLEDVIVTPSFHVFIRGHIRTGVVTEYLQLCLDRRADAKNALKKAKNDAEKSYWDSYQNTLKLCANATYGWEGSMEQAAVKPVAESTTALGVWCNLLAQECVLNDRPDASILYGDTDSIMVLGLADPPPPEMFEQDDKAAHLEWRRRTFAAGHAMAAKITAYIGFGIIKIVLEKIFEPFFLIAKKRYFGGYYEAPEEMSKIAATGLETQRRDNSAYLRKTMSDAQRAICTSMSSLEKQRTLQDDLEHTVRKAISRLVNGKISMYDLIISRQLARNVSDYKAAQPHTVLHQLQSKRDAGAAASVGERIQYVKVKGTLHEKTTQCGEDPLHAIRHGYQPDIRYYVDHQLKNPITKLLMPFVQLKIPDPPNADARMLKAVHAQRLQYIEQIFVIPRPKDPTIMRHMSGMADVQTRSSMTRRGTYDISSYTVVKQRPCLLCRSHDNDERNASCACEACVQRREMEARGEPVQDICYTCRHADDRERRLQTLVDRHEHVTKKAITAFKSIYDECQRCTPKYLSCSNRDCANLFRRMEIDQKRTYLDDQRARLCLNKLEW